MREPVYLISNTFSFLCRVLLMEAFDKRHDCVHRNENGTDGNKHLDIDQDFLRKGGTLFEGVVQSLEDSIGDARVKRFFEDLRPEHKKGS